MGKLVPSELEMVVVGLRHRVTPQTLLTMQERLKHEIMDVRIEREPHNPADENAIKVIIRRGKFKGMHIGYIPRNVAFIMAPAIDSGNIEISSAQGSIVEIDVQDGTATMLLKFKAAVKIRGRGSEGKKTKTA